MIKLLIKNNIKNNRNIKKEIDMNFENKDINNELKLLFNNNNYYYLPSIGITNFKSTMYNEFIKDRATVIFNILNSNNINYYVFAGSSIGLYRDGKNIPWVDDYDIIVLEDEYNKILKLEYIFNKNGFNFRHNKGQLQILSDNFLLDIFISINTDGILKNKSNKGLYNRKNVPFIWLGKPLIKRFENMDLPFFSNYKDDILKEYGDVINNVVIYLDHGKFKLIFNNIHYSYIYEKFNQIKMNAINNTKKIISSYISNHTPIYNYHLDRDDNILNIFRIIKLNNVKNLDIDDVKLIYHCINIKYYFDININFYIYEGINLDNYIHYFNYVDNVYYKSDKILELFNNIIFVKKPNFIKISLITFGTFDLLHIGHINLLNYIKSISEINKVGISSDKFNLIKNKTSIENENIRQNQVKKMGFDVFLEESFEKKLEYIKKYNSNILLMGDDWKGKFNNLGIFYKVIPRTPNISTSLLKKNLRVVN
jgi:glycerol-3-phosphate cytidylyltransferase